jgi:hypothetical protein
MRTRNDIRRKTLIGASLADAGRDEPAAAAVGGAG